MTGQETAKRINAQFSFAKAVSPKPMRVFTEFMTPKQFEAVLRFAHDELGYTKGEHIVGTDEGEDLGFSYIVADGDYTLLVIREKVPKADPKARSQAALYPSLTLHERELVDLFGADMRELPEGPSYPLPDGWPKGEYPLRKEWNPAYFNKDTMKYEPPAQGGGEADT
ncbi:MAG TPA: NADH-quinone oxidoreductase subunit C [Clostridia bacterium]|nr:NADH-quinone oxidoreductase subunit C [Clostridia bacterium]